MSSIYIENDEGGYALEAQSKRMQELAESANTDDVPIKPDPTRSSVRAGGDHTPNLELEFLEPSLPWKDQKSVQVV